MYVNELLRLLRSAADILQPFARQIRSGTLVWNGEEYALPEKLQEPDPYALMWFGVLRTIAELLERQPEITESQLKYLQDIFRGSMGSLADFLLDTRQWGKAARRSELQIARNSLGSAPTHEFYAALSTCATTGLTDHCNGPLAV